ncbi:hypothetical protein PFISCL1PPCAC_20288, partial [Pristionchus fissidentatus]
ARDFDELSNLFSNATMFPQVGLTMASMQSQPTAPPLCASLSGGNEELLKTLLSKIRRLEEELKVKTAQNEQLKEQLESATSSKPSPIYATPPTMQGALVGGEYKTFRILLPHVTQILVNGQRVASKPFILGGIHWEVLLTKTYDNYVNCSLKVCEPDALPKSTQIVGSFVVTLASLTGSSHKFKSFTLIRSFSADKPAWGCQRFIALEKLFKQKNRYVENGSILLRIDGAIYA